MFSCSRRQSAYSPHAGTAEPPEGVLVQLGARVARRPVGAVERDDFTGVCKPAPELRLDLLKPLITASKTSQYLGTVVIGTAQGDLHDIGKNLVAMMLEGAGFRVFNLGRDVAPEVFVAAVQEHNANVVGISALMTTTMPAMKRTIDALIKAGVRERVKVMIGGAPVSQAYADEIGADGYARDSTLAVVKAKILLGKEVAAGAAR